MSAAEFGLHMALERAEPLPAAVDHAIAEILAALANGEFKAPAPGRNWQASDFTRRNPWAAAEPQQATPQDDVSSFLAFAKGKV